MLHWIVALRGPRRRRVALAAAGVLAVLAWLAGDNDRLALYASEQSFVARQGARGMVVVGRFGPARWPALVVGRSDGERGVTFTAPDGQRHSYGGFQGRMKALELAGGTAPAARFVLVLADRPAPRDPLR